MNNIHPTRRALLLSVGALCIAGPVFALTKPQAKLLIDGMVAEINNAISFAESNAQIVSGFKQIFAKYADIPIMARFSLGPPARSASAADLKLYQKAFQGYLARKYGAQFRDFKDGALIVKSVRPAGKHHDVYCNAVLNGKQSLTIIFKVSDRSGQNKVFDLTVEGISLLKTEAVEIRALLEKNNGNIRALAKDLDTRG